MKLLQEAEAKLSELEPVLADLEAKAVSVNSVTGVTVHYSDGTDVKLDVPVVAPRPSMNRHRHLVNLLPPPVVPGTTQGT